MSMNLDKRMFKVISMVERKDGSTYWMRIGTGFPNRDQSINLYLDALPLNKKLQLRELTDEERDALARKRSDGPAPAAATPQDDLPF